MEVKSRTSEKALRQEVAYLLGEKEARRAIGALARRWAEKSPFLFGGEVDAEAVQSLLEACNLPAGSADDAEAILQELASALGVLGIFDSNALAGLEPYSPEWLADVLVAIAGALPSVSLRWILWDASPVLVFHLLGAVHRRNGGKTTRKADELEMAEALKEINHG